MTLRAALAELRGPIRDGVAAVQAFGQLLRSPKVGPRQLGRALPDVLRGAWQLSEDLAEAATGLGPGLPEAVGGAVVVALSAARDRTAVFAATLEGHGDKAIEARRRLELEGAVIRLSRELEGALCVIDFALAAASPRKVFLGVADLLRERKPPPALVQVPGVLDTPGMSVDADPLLISSLLDVATALLEPDPVRSGLRLEARPAEPGRVVLILRRVPRESLTPPAAPRPPLLHGRVAKPAPVVAPVSYSFPVRLRLPELEEVARVVGGLFGVTLSVDSGVASLTL